MIRETGMMNSPVSFMGNNPMKDRELEIRIKNYYAKQQEADELNQEDINDPETWGIII